MRKYGFDNEYGTTFSHGLRFLEFPQFDYGYEVIENKSIPGRVGTLTIHTGRYTDTVITNVLEFTSDTVELFETKLHEIKKWLLNTQKVSYSDKEDKLFLVKKVEFSNIKRKYGVFGNITVVFTCEPFAYLKSGEYEVEIGNVFNPCAWTQPLYKITGEGVCALTVNGKSVTANVSGDLLIDTKLMLCYRSDGTSQNTVVSGDYEELFLQEGENVISITDGFECKVVPRWRCL